MAELFRLASVIAARKRRPRARRPGAHEDQAGGAGEAFPPGFPGSRRDPGSRQSRRRREWPRNWSALVDDEKRLRASAAGPACRSRRRRKKRIGGEPARIESLRIRPDGRPDDQVRAFPPPGGRSERPPRRRCLRLNRASTASASARPLIHVRPLTSLRAATGRSPAGGRVPERPKVSCAPGRRPWRSCADTITPATAAVAELHRSSRRQLRGRAAPSPFSAPGFRHAAPAGDRPVAARRLGQSGGRGSGPRRGAGRRSRSIEASATRRPSRRPPGGGTARPGRLGRLVRAGSSGSRPRWLAADTLFVAVDYGMRPRPHSPARRFSSSTSATSSWPLAPAAALPATRIPPRPLEKPCGRPRPPRRPGPRVAPGRRARGRRLRVGDTEASRRARHWCAARALRRGGPAATSVLNVSGASRVIELSAAKAGTRRQQGWGGRVAGVEGITRAAGARATPPVQDGAGGAGSGAGSQETAAPDAWRRQRLEASPPSRDSRLVASYRLATLILRESRRAEDATQEAIARAWSSWETLRDTSRFDAWFDRILVNVCRNRMRHSEHAGRGRRRRP